VFEDLDILGHVLTRRNWTCCNTCGTADIYDLKEEVEEEENDGEPYYKGFIFYHDQEKDMILEQFLENSGNKFDVHIHLNWGLFEPENPTDEEYQQFADEIKNFVSERFTRPNGEYDTDAGNVRIEGGDINKKLEMWITTGP
jgi:hypothetical protein